MGVLVFKVPHETARLFGEVNVRGDREPSDSLHITLLYLGDNVPMPQLAKAMVAAYEVTSKTQPFTVRTSTVSCFPKADSGKVPIICRIDSDALHSLQARLRKAFDKHGVEYSKKWPTFKPHVTLSYADDEIEERRIPTIEWGAHELTLWGGDDGDRRVYVTFPLTLGPIAQRVASRFSHGALRGIQDIAATAPRYTHLPRR